MALDPAMSCHAAGVTSLWTIGYERLMPEALVAELRAAGVRLSKTRLGALLGEHGIAYESRRGLGTPPDLRFLYRSGRIAEAEVGFRRHLEATAADELDALAAELPDAAPTALLCLEADPAHCHRRVVAEALARRRPGLAVIDL
jgi:uncharacterized protein (DUF488 family)